MLTTLRKNIQIGAWHRRGRPMPAPHALKERVVREYAARYSLRILIETGTYYGEMVEAQRRYFDSIYSIELGSELYKRAKERFRGYPRITILQGDSGHVLPELLKRINEPALFWLDAHYSSGVTVRGNKETPLLEELHAVLSHLIAGHVILIDDARSLGTGDYPSAEAIKGMARALTFEMRDDIIRLTSQARRLAPSFAA